jgi:hypothetical protein
MAWGWLLKRFTDVSRSTGLWSHLASKAREKSKIELEKTRTEATKQLIDHLPYGAVLREGTTDGWREIQMPDAPQSPLLILPMESHGPGGGALKPTESGQPLEVFDESRNPDQCEGPYGPPSACQLRQL